MDSFEILRTARLLMRAYGLGAEDAVEMAAAGSALRSFDRACMVLTLEAENPA